MREFALLTADSEEDAEDEDEIPDEVLAAAAAGEWESIGLDSDPIPGITPGFHPESLDTFLADT